MSMSQKKITVRTSKELNLREKFSDVTVDISEVSALQQRTETPSWKHYVAGTGKPYIISNIHLRDGRTLCSNFTVAELLMAAPEISAIGDLKIIADLNGGAQVHEFRASDFTKNNSEHFHSV